MSGGGLARALAGLLQSHPPVDVDGCAVALSARPADEAELGLVLRLASEQRAAVIPCGAGTRLSLGNPPQRADLLLDTRALSGVLDLDASEGVCQAGAGTTLGALREALSDTGWELPLDAPDASTLGGTLASAAIGPRSAGFGLPRDVVLGLGVVGASGVRTQCGGRVVKNVTGYDMAKLYTGSLGTLGVLTSAWLRLRPRPARTRVLALELPRDRAAREGVAIARRNAVRACVLASSGDSYRCVVELAGDATSVDEAATWLEREQRARESSGEALDAIQRRQSEPCQGRMRFRIGCVASQLGRVLAALERAEVAHLAHPGLGVVYAIFEPEQREGAFALVVEAASGRDYCCEAAPPESKRGRDVFGDPGGALPLMRALKQRFDPGGVLNPGRFAGGV